MVSIYDQPSNDQPSNDQPLVSDGQYLMIYDPPSEIPFVEAFSQQREQQRRQSDAMAAETAAQNGKAKQTRQKHGEKQEVSWEFPRIS